MKKLLSCLSFTLCMQIVNAQQIIPLYDGKVPNSLSTGLQEKNDTTGGKERYSNVIIPTLKVYEAPKDKATGAAVIICPGGGYGVLAYTHEGTDVAQKFNEMGITAFVLKYRLPNSDIMAIKEIGPLQDAQQAIKLVREQAATWNINPQKIGLMGFSAGGHLASTAGTHFDQSYIDNLNNTNLRPDFLVLIYPVISFKDSLTHMGSRNNLIGKNPHSEKVKAFSNEEQVSSQTPPTFLVHASDDKGVLVGNSLAFYQALVQHNVKAEMHIYQSGGHGFGMFIKGDKDLWMERLQNWLLFNGIIK